MKKILYSKYNNHRAPGFRTAVTIVEEDGRKYVEKKALGEKAVSHIERIAANYDLCDSSYRQARALPCELLGDRIRQEYLEGESLKISVDIAHCTKAELKQAVLDIMEPLFDFSPECRTEFRITEG
ncbi:MAG: hypothetical protein K5840_08435, partial [Eubacterium sp.]|nr:hypothetical protein [Eubacterium sp.]